MYPPLSTYIMLEILALVAARCHLCIAEIYVSITIQLEALTTLFFKRITLIVIYNTCVSNHEKCHYIFTFYRGVNFKTSQINNIISPSQVLAGSWFDIFNTCDLFKLNQRMIYLQT